jgi:cytochrome c biogenesis protein CcmG/thiol:disulfide interchange protein DsbE
MNHYIIPLLIFFTLVTILGIGLNYDPRRIPSPLIDKPMPAFSLPRLKEPDAILSTDDLGGEVVLLNVWASWCIACRQEHPILAEMAENRNVKIYGLNYKDMREKALRWLEKHGDPYIISAFDQNGKVGIDLGVYGVPETYVLDRNGIIRYKHIGPITRDVMDSIILPMIQRLDEPLS